jgi:hypothetical protein
VKGYALGKKMWVQLDVNKVQIIVKKRDETAFNKLVLPPKPEWKDVKEILSFLVLYHANANTKKVDGVPGQLKDLVEGKGQGLVILLHGRFHLLPLHLEPCFYAEISTGASGVGKTLTAGKEQVPNNLENSVF